MTQEDLGSKPTHVHYLNWMEDVRHHPAPHDLITTQLR